LKQASIFSVFRLDKNVTCERIVGGTKIQHSSLWNYVVTSHFSSKIPLRK